jgi:uncharacterized protein YjiS (DUF1127 family)
LVGGFEKSGKTLTRFPCKENTMFHDTSASHRTRRKSFLSIAIRPWQMLSSLMTDRQTYAELSRLDDFILKDIGISRGSIRSAIREGRTRR